MSSILKALKKLEDEQAGRQISSSAESDRQLGTPMRSGRPLLLLIGGIGVGLLLSGGLYLWLGGRRDIQSPPSPAVMVQKPADIPEKTAPGACPVVAEPSPATPTAAPVAASPVKLKVAAAPPAAEKVAAVAAAAEIKAEMATPSEPSVPSKALETSKVPVEQIQIERRDIPAPGQQWTAPHLTVSEILPASGGGRMAIVNGLPVMEGTMVEDAVVRDIRPDRVIFEVDGKSVVVPLASSR